MADNHQEELPWVLVPYQQLAHDTLTAVLEEFISREGTDYGLQEVPFERQLEKAQAEIKNGDVLIVFDLHENNCQLMRREAYQLQVNQFRSGLLAAKQK